VELCQKAAVEQDPAKLLELTSEANMTSGGKNLPVGVLLVVVLLLGVAFLLVKSSHDFQEQNPAAALKNDLPETPVILFTLTDLLPNSLCETIGVDFISKVDGIPKLLERVDALLGPTRSNGKASIC
jgi:hypothetical protein